jgi:PilZ domain-containing protein
MTISDGGRSGEKRQSRRVITQQCYLRLQVKLPLLMREISGGGAMLESPVPVAPERDGMLRTMLAARPFETRVAVCRTHPAATDARKTSVSVTFKDMGTDASQVLNHFLKLAAPEPYV